MIKVLGLLNKPALTAVLLIHEEEGSPPSWFACERVVSMAGSPMLDFISSSGDFNAPPLRITLLVADKEMVLVVLLALMMTPVATPPGSWGISMHLASS